MIAVSSLVKHASEVTTEEGNTYYKIPFWFQVSRDGTVTFLNKMPEDLSMFVCKSGLGGDNPKLKEPEE